MNKPLVYGIITARGGSKSVPKKNIKEICGKPLIAWTIESALRAKNMDRLICSTDSEEIAEVARAYGAETPFIRPAEFAQDLTPDLPVFVHALEWLKEHEGVSPEAVVHLRPTGPLRTTADVEQAIDLLLAHPEADSVRCVAEAPLHPVKTYKLDGDRLLPFVPDEVVGMVEAYNQPRQKLPKAYASLAYLSTIWSRTILDGKSICGKHIIGMIVPEINCVDINGALDFEFARVALAQRLQGLV